MTVEVQNETVLLNVDNQGALALAKNPVYHQSQNISILDIILSDRKFRMVLSNCSIFLKRIMWLTCLLRLCQVLN